MSPDAAAIASRLTKAKRTGAGWIACCPAHEDSTPSLSITDGESGRVVVRCHAGCSQDSVLDAIEALGVQIRKPKANGNGAHHGMQETLTLETLAAAKGLALGTLHDNLVHETHAGVGFTYTDAAGERAGMKVRRYLGGSEHGKGFSWEAGSKPCLYGLWRLERDFANDGRLILCEGETDALTLWQHGYTALALPGASMWREEWLALIPPGAKVYVILEPDQGGRTVEAAVMKSELRHRAYFIRMTEAAKDPNQLHMRSEAGFVDDFDKLVARADPAEKFTGLTGVDFADMNPHLLDGYLVKGVLPAQGEASIIGASGSGKTFLATDLALHIAADRPWRGIRVRGGLVVYVGVESPRSVERRFYAARHAGTFPASTPIRLTPGPINMLDGESVSALIEFCRAAEAERGLKCVAVFIDTLARAMSGGEENSNDTMSMVTRTGCDRIRDELKATVVVIHHLGKDLERGSRGGSAFPAAMDAEIAISEEQEGRVATIKKARDGREGERYGFKLKVVELGLDEDGDQVTSCIVEHMGAMELSIKKPSGKYQLQLLAELERLTDLKPSTVWTDPDLREIARNLGQAKNTAREAVFGLKRLGYFLPSIGGSRLNYASKTAG